MPTGITCLLPIRNGAKWLPAYLANTRSIADRLIALDDGSTDASRELLERDPLVERILTNPVRRGYAGWDDRANRQRLLDACGDFDPKWLLWLDADELIPESDIPLLRGFVRNEARETEAYGFEVHRMVRDLSHFDRNKLWVYRLFAFREGLRLPSAKLHFEPVPEQVPRRRWVRTRLRILHRSSMTAALRRARFRKYLAADPGRAWQSSYDDLLEGPAHVWTIKPLDPARGMLIRPRQPPHKAN